MAPPFAPPSAPGSPGVLACARRALVECWPALAALALALVLRHGVVEPAALAHVCDPRPWQGWCAARSLVIQAFLQQRVGWLALAVGVLAFASGRRGLARLALAAGAFGLVLYSYEPSAIGALLGGLVLVRQRRPSVSANA